MKNYNNFDDLYCDIADILDGCPLLDHLYNDILRSVSQLFQNSTDAAIGDGNGGIFQRSDIAFHNRTSTMHGIVLPTPVNEGRPYIYQIIFSGRKHNEKYLTVSIYTKGVHFTVPKTTACWGTKPLDGFVQ